MMYFQQCQGTPGTPVMVNGLTMPAEDGSVADSDESISSAGNDKKKKIGHLANSKSSNSDLVDSNSVDSYNSNESYRLADMDYTQEDGTQLDPYQQGPLEQEHEIIFQLDSDDDSHNGPGTTRSERTTLYRGLS